MNTVTMKRNVTKYILQIYLRKMKYGVTRFVIKGINYVDSIPRQYEKWDLVIIAHPNTQIILKKLVSSKWRSWKRMWYIWKQHCWPGQNHTFALKCIKVKKKCWQSCPRQHMLAKHCISSKKAFNYWVIQCENSKKNKTFFSVAFFT